MLSGLEAIETLKAAGYAPARPIAFTIQKGVRSAPDMIGSRVYSGGLSIEEALATIGTDGTTPGAELERIRYAGPEKPGFLRSHAYVERHIARGPALERAGVPIGAVENILGISWQRIPIDGEANHAGTTPMSMRRDAGHAAARVATVLRDRAQASSAPTGTRRSSRPGGRFSGNRAGFSRGRVGLGSRGFRSVLR